LTATATTGTEGCCRADEARPLAYSVAEAARLLGCDPRTLKRLIDLGECPARPLGKERMIPSAWVHSYGEWEGKT
jgi:excisionase family DNA binding protein